MKVLAQLMSCFFEHFVPELRKGRANVRSLGKDMRHLCLRCIGCRNFRTAKLFLSWFHDSKQFFSLFSDSTAALRLVPDSFYYLPVSELRRKWVSLFSQLGQR
jgi:hypothetical protein